MATYTDPYPSKTSWELRLVVLESNLEPENNRSYVNWSLRLYRGNSDTPWNESSTSYQVWGPGGVSGSFPAYRFGSSGSGTNYSGVAVGSYVEIADGGAWVTHNADGTGSVTVRGRHEAGSTLGTADTGSRTFTLTKLTQKPFTPTNVALAYTSDTQATFSWQNNYESNGVPTSNQIQTSVNGAAFTQVASIARATSLVLSAAANQKITARVRATNSEGSSAYSVASNPVFTTPAAPSGVSAAKDAALDIVVSWTPNVAFSEHQHVVEHGSVSGGVTTWDAAPIGTVAAGTSSFKHVAPNASQVHVYRVKAKNTDTGARQSAAVVSNQVQLLVAPNKPTVPALPAYRDKGKDFVLTWTHNPVDTTAQTAYEVNYSTNGGTTWSTTGKVASSTSARTFAANTYSANTALTVRVRTWGQATTGGSDGTGVSPWSDPQTVTFKTRPVVSVLSPANGSTWGEAELSVGLGFSQAEGATFVRATVELKSGTTVLETLDTTTLAATQLASRVENGTTYTLTVTAIDSNGLTSDPTVSTFTVAYTLPVPASVAAAYFAEVGVTQLDLGIPAPVVGQAVAVAVTITRTIDGVVETVADRYPVSGSVLTILDTTPTIRGVNDYLVSTHSADGATAETAVTVVTEEVKWAFLSTGAGFSHIVSFFGNLKFESAPQRSFELVQTAGRPRPIALFGASGSLEVSGSARLVSGQGSSPQEIEQFLLTAGVVCYRDPSGRRMFGAVSGSIDSESSVVQEFKFKVTEAS